MQFQGSREQMVNSSAQDKLKLVQMFKESIEAKDYDTAFLVYDKFKLLPMGNQQEFEIAKIFHAATSKDNGIGIKQTAKNEGIDASVILTAKPGLIILQLIDTAKALTANLDPFTQQLHKEMQDLCINGLKQHGIEIVNTSPLTLAMSEDASAGEKLLASLTGLHLSQLPIEIRIQMFVALAHNIRTEVYSYGDLIDAIQEFNLTEARPSQLQSLIHNIEVLKNDSDSTMTQDFYAVLVEVHLSKLKSNVDEDGTQLEICQKLILEGSDAAANVAKNFNTYNLGKASPQERFGLCQSIALQGKTAAESLMDTMEKFGVNDFSHAERFALCQTIAQQGALTADSLMSNFENLSWFAFQPQERMAILEIVTKNDGKEGIKLAKDFHKCGFPKNDIINFAISIATLGDGQLYQPLGELARAIDDVAVSNKLALHSLRESIYFFFTFSDEIKSGEMQELKAILDSLNTFSSIGTDEKELSIEINKFINTLSMSDQHKQKIVALKDDFFTHAPTMAVKSSYLQGLMLSIASFALNPASRDWMLNSPIAKSLADTHNPTVRLMLGLPLIAMTLDQDKYAYWHSLLDGTSQKSPFQLMLLPIGELEKEGVDREFLSTITKQLEKRYKDHNSPIHDASNLQKMLQGLNSIAHASHLSKSEKELALRKIFPNGLENFQGSDRDILSSVQAAQALLRFKNQGWVSSEKSLPELITEAFVQILPLGKVQGDLVKPLNEIFGKNRSLADLAAYTAGLYTLGQPAVMDSLGEILESLLDGDFPKMRYSLENNLHLQKIAENHGSVLEKWQNSNVEKDLKNINKQSDFDTSAFINEKLSSLKQVGEFKLPYLQGFFENKKFDGLRKELVQAIKDRENVIKQKNSFELDFLNLQKQLVLLAGVSVVDSNKIVAIHSVVKSLIARHPEKLRDLNPLPDAAELNPRAWLQGLQGIDLPFVQQRLQNAGELEVRTAIDSAISDLKMKEKQLLIKTLAEDLELNVLRLQSYGLSLAAFKPTATPEKTAPNAEKSDISAFEGRQNALERIMSIMKILDPDSHSTFTKDITNLYKDLKTAALEEKQTVGYKASLTDKFIDILYCGSDVSDSCQRLDGRPDLNKGLLGYLRDGKIKLLAIKDPEGNITDRALLKLLWDGQKPVLFLEQLYGAGSALHTDMLKGLARDCANKLKVPLTSAGGGQMLYGQPLYALGGPAPAEYSDAAGGAFDNGVYSVLADKVHLLA